MASPELSRDEARRLALRAQGFYEKPIDPNRSALRRTLRNVKLFQIDSVNVLVRSHYVPLFSRIGIYPMELLREAAWGARSKRLLFEYWAHEASLLPLEMRRLFAWRMDDARAGRGTWKGVAAVRRKKKLIASILSRIEDQGACTASSFENPKRMSSWWSWSEAKTALEYLFWSGDVTSATRTTSFERVYDLPERVFPESVLRAPIPLREEAYRELLVLALDAMGIATEADLRDYFRLDVKDTRTALQSLIEEGRLVETTVKGWKQRAFMAPNASVPRSEPERAALLSPFDSLVWKRDRAHQLFDFHYRIEIYTPAHKRIHGYYVLPFLHNGRLVARVDLKADRASRSLLVLNEHFEESAPRDSRAALDKELHSMAAWLELDAVERRGAR